jgi:hypothetical protein
MPDPHRRSLRPSCPRLASRHHLPLRTLFALRPRISGGAGAGDSGRRALSSNTLLTSNATFPNSNNIVLSDVVHSCAARAEDSPNLCCALTRAALPLGIRYI